MRKCRASSQRRDPRQRAWLILADLWLDQETQPEALSEMATALIDTGLLPSELERIYCEDLAPVLSPNHRAPAGVWDSFDPEWLIRTIEESCRKRSWGERIKRRFLRRYYTASTWEDWRRIRSKLTTSSHPS